LVFVILTTIGIFIQACILHSSDKTFQETATAAREANEINIRPYIKINFLPETFTFKLNVAIKFTIENIGKLPGYVRVATGFTWVTRNHPRPENTPKQHSASEPDFCFQTRKALPLLSQQKISVRGKLPICNPPKMMDEESISSFACNTGPRARKVDMERRSVITTSFLVEELTHAWTKKAFAPEKV
jgi:hypothetical protein